MTANGHWARVLDSPFAHGRRGQMQREAAAQTERAEAWLTGSAFALFGLMFGMWQVVLPDLQLALHLSAGELGQALSVGFITALPLAVLGGRLADRWGARALLAGGALLMALALAGLAGVTTYGALLVLMLVFFGASGAFDVGISAAAIAQEQATGRRRLTGFHAAFSGAAAAGALLGGLLVYAGMPYRWLYAGLAAAMVALALVAGRSQITETAPAEAAEAHSLPTRRAVWRLPGLLALAGVVALAFLVEGTLEDWSAIYLRSALALPAVLGAAGLVVFHLAMLAGRLVTGRLEARVGRRRLLQLGGGLTAAGMLVALATPQPPVVLAGLLLAGLALAALAPAAFSLAGDLAPERVGEASALITTIGYLGFLAGPALIGGLTEAVGMRAALGTLVAAGLLIVGLSWGVPLRRT